MPNEREAPSPRDVVNVSVPPIPDPVPDAFVDPETGELRTEQLAAFAREQSGTCGGIGVGLELVEAVVDDLRTFDERGTRPGELRHHLEMLAELERVLVETADAEIDGYEEPLYEPAESGDSPPETDGDPPSEDGGDSPPGTEGEPSEPEYPRAAFKRGYVDRISGSDNLLAIPRDDSYDHIHVAAGVLGKECVLYDPTESFERTSAVSEKPIALPVSEIDAARAYLSEQSQIPVRQGEVIQVPTEPEEGDLVPLPGRDVDGVLITGGRRPKHGYALVQVTKLRDDVAVGKIVVKNDIRTGTRPEWVRGIVKARKKRRKRRKKRKKRRTRKQTRTQKRVRSGGANHGSSNLNELLKGLR